MQTITYYSVHDVFTVDGMGPETVIGRFGSEEVAKEYAKDRGNYKKDAYVTPHTLVICSSIEELAQAKKEELKQHALSKLTKEEKEILGL
ncbi:MAG: hypothetical protein HF309_19225 [Ignavibacteria bacterium]|jgi:alkanesulfonate monooxygenase SsuD/methylene tetrahydromethanopterin reductase-like flavin-dependent oxidoreductase (luciferase family)|nr:hypothetical protein [Ignavibacteria bacterium]MCU7518533.1 hypothetical protein [Ignavibacteria bacterium]